MNVAIYTRVSTQQQAEHGYSIEEQENACRKKALELGATSIKVYRDSGFSGAYLERPALDDLRDAVAQKLHDAIVIYDIDRLSRDTMHLLLLTEEFEKNAKVVYVNSEYSRTPEGQLFFEIRGSFAKYERVKIRDRFQRGMRGKLRKGLPISDHQVFGYSWDGQNYVINPEQAEIVRQCFEKYVHSLGGYRYIIDWLEEQGIPSPKGAKRWSDFGMMRLLKRQMYTGEYFAYTEYHKKISANKFEYIKRDSSEWIPMTCPAIISKELFEQAQDKLKRNKQQKIRETKHLALLSGVIYCGCCGRKMRPAHEPMKYGLYYYYQCNAVSQKDKSCTNHSVSIEATDTIVWEIIKKVCKNETMLKRYIQQNQPKQKDNTDAIKKQLAGIETKRQAIMSWFSANLISAEESTQKLQALKKQEQSLQDRLTTKKEDIPTDQIVKDVRHRITQEDKRQFILQHIQKVIILRKDFADVHDIDLDVTIVFRS